MACHGKTLVYITAGAPWGTGETFTMMTLLELRRKGVHLLVIPRNPPREIFHKEGDELLGSALWLPLIDLRMTAVFLVALFTSGSLLRPLARIIRGSRTPLILAKNLAVVPKATFIASRIQKEEVSHIHAEWGSTTSTMAYVISQMTGLPWSFTLHRWDIKEDNMLKEKARSAEFIRCISRDGEKELSTIIGSPCGSKVNVVHLGVRMPLRGLEMGAISDPPVIAVPANLVEVKGHKYLVRALSIVAKHYTGRFECVFYGDGPLRSRLERLVHESGLDGIVEMPGAIPHERLMGVYISGKAHIVVLPSVTTSHGEREGIPVSLMEAMSFGIPVVSTPTGGIPELICDGAGIMVEERNIGQLAEAIAALLADAGLRQRIGTEGQRRVRLDFNISAQTTRLVELMKLDRGSSGGLPEAGCPK